MNNKHENHEEFQYFLRDKETVVNFDAPTEILREYLNETNDAIASIKNRVENLYLQADFKPEIKEEKGYNHHLRKAKIALAIQHSLRNRLINELKAREEDKIGRLKKIITKQANLIHEQRRIVKKVTGLSITKLSRVASKDLQDESVEPLQEAFKTIKEKDRIIQEQRSHLAALNKIVSELKEVDSTKESPQNRYIKDLQRGIEKRDVIIRELLELDGVSLKEIRITLRDFKKRQQEQKQQEESM